MNYEQKAREIVARLLYERDISGYVTADNHNARIIATALKEAVEAEKERCVMCSITSSFIATCEAIEHDIRSGYEK